MFNLNIICIGKIKEKFIQLGLSEYLKRLSYFCRLNIIEIPEYKLSSSPSASDINRCILEEEKALLSYILSKNTYKVCLDIYGDSYTSEQFSGFFLDLGVRGFNNISFFIGGSFGIGDKLKQICDKKISFSQMTFPHQLFRLLLVEQIYRAFSINNNGNYHK